VVSVYRFLPVNRAVFAYLPKGTRRIALFERDDFAPRRREALLHVLRDGVEAQDDRLQRLTVGEHRPDFKPKPPI
jgi:hypothetical protein